MKNQDVDIFEDGLGRDMMLAEALTAFDPAARDPGYWLRFRSWVMTGAARELARRRFVAQMTIGDVVQSWARALVPTAVLTAVIAGLVLMHGGLLAPPRPISVEELLVSEIDGEPLPVMLEPGRAPDAVTFASEGF
jgi:hypothetical protein